MLNIVMEFAGTSNNQTNATMCAELWTQLLLRSHEQAPVRHYTSASALASARALTSCCVTPFMQSTHEPWQILPHLDTAVCRGSHTRAWGYLSVIMWYSTLASATDR